MLERRSRVPMLLVAITLVSSLALATQTAPAQGRPAKPVSKGGGKQEPEAPAATTHLRLGKLERAAGRIASLPVYYNPGHAREVGTIRAEVTVPGSSWIFQTAETPQGAWWKIFSKEKVESGPGESGGSGRRTLIDLNFSSTTRAIPEGLIGYLRFQVEPVGTPLPAGTAIRKTDMAGISAQPSRAVGSGGMSTGGVSDRPVSPVSGCFFYMH